MSSLAAGMALVVDSFEMLIKGTSEVMSQQWSSFVDVVTIIGAWYTFRFTVDVGYYTIIHIKQALCRPRNFVKDYGRWAVVTGTVQKSFVQNTVFARYN